MGLRQIKLNPHSGHARSWILPVVLAALCLLGLVFGEAMRDQLRYERAAIPAGEIYRLLSGHFVHLGVGHALLYALGLGLVWLLVGGAFSLLGWIIALGIVIAVIDLGFWFLMPSLVAFWFLAIVLGLFLFCLLFGCLCLVRAAGRLLQVTATPRLLLVLGW